MVEMTEVAFHFNTPDRIAYACRLLRKAVASGAKLVVTGSTETLQQLDIALWNFSPSDFVPHCYVHDHALLVNASPVVLSASAQAGPHRQVLVNLDTCVPEGFEHFDRVIELVGLDDEDRQLARRRWKHYVDQGYAITRHDLTLKAPH
jgi:DNA polymerase-3 subunit chi